MQPTDLTNKNLRFVGRELLLWLTATLIGVAGAIQGTWMIGRMADLSSVKLVCAVAIIALMSLTWGSWASLLWTRRSSVRKAITLSTQMPALWMIGIGALFYWAGALTTPIILSLIGGGIGLVFVSHRLTQSVRRLHTQESDSSALLLSIIHPLVSAFAVSGFLFLWVGQTLPETTVQTITLSSFGPFNLETLLDLIRHLDRFPELIKALTNYTWRTVVGVSLISTIIPAFISELFSRLLIFKFGARE